MAIVVKTIPWTVAQKWPTAEDIDKSVTIVTDDSDLGTWRTIEVVRCGSCAARLLYFNLTPDLEGNCPKCGDPLVVE